MSVTRSPFPQLRRVNGFRYHLVAFDDYDTVADTCPSCRSGKMVQRVPLYISDFAKDAKRPVGHRDMCTQCNYRTRAMVDESNALGRHRLEIMRRLLNPDEE